MPRPEFASDQISKEVLGWSIERKLIDWPKDSLQFKTPDDYLMVLWHEDDKDSDRINAGKDLEVAKRDFKEKTEESKSTSGILIDSSLKWIAYSDEANSFDQHPKAYIAVASFV